MDIFYSAVAQQENLGDVVIRAVALAWINASGRHKIHVLATGMADDYLDAAVGRPAPDAIVHRSDREYIASWGASLRQGEAGLVFAPGPRSAAGSRGAVGAAARAWMLAAVTRSRRGSVVGIGGALSGRNALAVQLHRRTAGRAEFYGVRDPVSCQLIGVRAHLVPDVALDMTRALGLDSRNESDRYVAISLRDPRAVPLSNLRHLMQRSRKQGLEPVIVTQVRRDEAGHQALADALGIEHVGWCGRSTGDQLDRVLSTYRSSALVVSDRLHACVFGGMAGALVVNAEQRPGGKIDRTLSWFMDPIPLRRLIDGDLRDDWSPLSSLRDVQAARLVVADELLQRGRRAAVAALEHVDGTPGDGSDRPGPPITANRTGHAG
ncbi:polysaccharide pyruvyl transferase family protein [Nakamurella leprariae]|uniref:Polysaccharide pyruvyl transferase family protein n=1 Tax=Nakamurella leprariae TaxID=2803911 RepID=A0A939C3I1_9ACTN|nr:polysaccharide pyruvyl transferase family protein [Nakamurella leprariae]MBM9469122.1 polysaccharide pyruvyl transferase family protein [Nakamurella leprariae]